MQGIQFYYLKIFHLEPTPNFLKIIKQLLRTTEMRIIRAIYGKTLWDRIRSKDLRELSGIQDIVEWIDVRKRGWGEHVERMTDETALQKS